MSDYLDVHRKQNGDRLHADYERRLVARLQSGEGEALSILFELYLDQVFAYARHLLGNREDAEEVSTEAFMRAFEKAGSFRGDAPFRSWLFSITRNLCLDRMRQPKLLLMEPEDLERADVRESASQQIDTSIIVRQALETLPEDQRMALLLCDVEEWNAGEAALMLDRSLAATKSLLYRARRAMRDTLMEMLKEEGD